MSTKALLSSARRSKSSLEPLEARIAPASAGGGFGTNVVTLEYLLLRPDLVLTKTADVDTAHPGDLITYTLHLSNEGINPSTEVTVTDPVVAGLNFVPTENPGWSLNQAKTAYVYNYGTLAGGGTAADLTLKLRVSPTVAADLTEITNAASVSGADDELTTLNNGSSATVAIDADATLHITLRSDTDEVAHGGKVYYSLIYSNTGDRDAHVILTEHPHSPYTVNLAENPGWVYNGTLSRYEYDAGTLAARSGNHSVPFVVQMDSYIPTNITRYINDAGIEYAPDVAESGNASSDTQSTASTPIYQGIYVLSPGTSLPGQYALPKIQVFDISTGVKKEIQVYPKIVRDSIRTSLGDFNNDGFDDILVTTEHGVGPARLFDGKTGALADSPLNNLQPFGKNRGSFVAVGQLNNPSTLTYLGYVDTPEVVFGSALGGGAVKIYSLQDSQTSSGVEKVAQPGTTFFPFGPKFTGGVRVAIGDINGDGRDDLVVAQGNFGGQVKVYNGGNPNDLLTTFQVGGLRYKGGLNLAVGDIDGNGRADIVTGRNRLSAPTVETFVYRDAVDTTPAGMVLKGSFNAFAPTYKNGVRVALADVDHDGYMDIIATTGFAGRSQVKVFDGMIYHTAKVVAHVMNPTLGTIIGVPSGPSVSVAAEPEPVITDVPPLLKSFTAIPTNLNQAVWASASTIVPSIYTQPVFTIIEGPIAFPFPLFPFPPFPILTPTTNL